MSVPRSTVPLEEKTGWQVKDWYSRPITHDPISSEQSDYCLQRRDTCVLWDGVEKEPWLCECEWNTFLFKEKKKKSLICSVCWLWWCKCSHCGHFQATNGLIVTGSPIPEYLTISFHMLMWAAPTHHSNRQCDQPCICSGVADPTSLLKPALFCSGWHFNFSLVNYSKLTEYSWNSVKEYLKKHILCLKTTRNPRGRGPFDSFKFKLRNHHRAGFLRLHYIFWWLCFLCDFFF